MGGTTHQPFDVRRDRAEDGPGEEGQMAEQHREPPAECVTERTLPVCGRMYMMRTY